MGKISIREIFIIVEFELRTYVSCKYEYSMHYFFKEEIPEHLRCETNKR